MEKAIERLEGKENKKALVDTACQELMVYGLWDGKTKMKRWISKRLLKRQVAPEDVVFWPTGLLAAGLWQYRMEITGQAGVRTAADKAGQVTDGSTAAVVEQIDSVLLAYYERWRHRGYPVSYLDDLLAGETLLSAYEAYRKDGRSNGIIQSRNAESYWEAIEKLAAYGLNYPTDEMGSFPYRAAQKNGQVFVDAIGLACPFLYRYGVECERTDAMELAVKQIVNFLAYGMDGVTGLP